MARPAPLPLAAAILASVMLLASLAAAQTPRPRPAATTVLIIRVTDSFGATMNAVKVSASGPVARSGITDAAGEVRFTGVRAGVYRVRFEGDKVITFEREVVVAAGQPTTIEVSLSPAPPPPPPPPAPKPEPPPAPPPVPAPDPKTVAIPDFVERNLLTSREPSKLTLVACGATSVTNLVQIREPLKDEVHQSADELLYVVGGEGTLVLGSQQVPLQAGTFSVVPRGATHSLLRRGSRWLIVIATLTDTPCSAK